MEAYPEDYVEHNLPLILLSGLGAEPEASEETSERSRRLLLEGGFRIKTDTPPLTSSTAENLLRAFLSADSSEASWNNRASSTTDGDGRFRIKRVGRVGQAPFCMLVPANSPMLQDNLHAQC